MDRAHIAAVELEALVAGLDPDRIRLVPRPAWHARAACRGQATALFFPVRGESAAPAKAICERCPVIADCRTYALSFERGDNMLQGIWGGLSGRQRRQARRDAADGRTAA